MSLLLASSSAIRQAMLNAAGVEYDALAAGVDEAAVKARLAGDPAALALELANAKAEAISMQRPEQWVIGSDSVVSVGGRLFDKPVSREDAAEHLRAFSGQPMQLVSAVALARGGAIDWSHCESATLHVRDLSEDFHRRLSAARMAGGVLLRRGVPDGGTRRAIVRPHRGRPFHHPRHAAAAFARRAAGPRDHSVVIERDYPPLVPQDGRLSTEQSQGQGWQNKQLFYGHPPGERPYIELIGDPVEHPLLLDIIRFWIEQLGMSVDCRMRHVAIAEAGDYIDHSRADPRWRGAIVTGDLRTAIKPHVSLVARDFDQLPFVDTVFRWELGWPAGLVSAAAGFWKTVEQLLKEKEFPLWYASVQIVGSGPDAFSAAGMFVEQKFDNIWFYAADLQQGRRLARQLRLGEERALPLDALGPVPLAAQGSIAANTGSPHMLINTTRMGIDGEGELPVNLDLYPPATLVYDFAYEPRETQLLRAAHKRGMAAQNGLRLLVEQVGKAFWCFVLATPPRNLDAELIARLG